MAPCATPGAERASMESAPSAGPTAPMASETTVPSALNPLHTVAALDTLCGTKTSADVTTLNLAVKSGD